MNYELCIMQAYHWGPLTTPNHLNLTRNLRHQTALLEGNIARLAPLRNHRALFAPLATALH